MLDAKLSPKKVSSLSSRAQVPTFSVVLLVLVCFPSMTRPSFSCLARPSKVDPVKLTGKDCYRNRLLQLGNFLTYNGTVLIVPDGKLAVKREVT